MFIFIMLSYCYCLHTEPFHNLSAAVAGVKLLLFFSPLFGASATRLLKKIDKHYFFTRCLLNMKSEYFPLRILSEFIFDT